MKTSQIAGNEQALVPVQVPTAQANVWPSSLENCLLKIYRLVSALIGQPQIFNEDNLPQLATRVHSINRETALQILNFDPTNLEPEESAIENHYTTQIQTLIKRKSGLHGPVAIYFQRMIDDAHQAYTTLTGKPPFLKE